MNEHEGGLWVDVAVPVPLRYLLTYAVPSQWREVVAPGQRVLVRVGPRRMTGLVVAVVPPRVPEPPGLRDIEEVIDREPLLPEELLSFVLRAADYYMCPPGEALRAALPPGMSAAEKGGRLRSVRRDPPTVLCVRRHPGCREDPREALKRAPAQARLLARVPDEAEIPLEELRRHHRQASQLVRELAAKGWVELVERPPAPDPLLAELRNVDEPPELTGEQATAVNRIRTVVAEGGYRGILLHGVTGSGKTEVYLHAIERVLDAGRSAVVLVPEIALTPQLVARFRARLGRTVGVLHSGLTPAQRLREWWRLRSGEARVAIGARSAIFAPVTELGMVVVDEEHDASFKQEEGFRYHGRDMALLRAQRAGATAILGSATPALETTSNAIQGKLERLVLSHRATPRPLPKVETIDLRRHRSGPGGQIVVSAPLAEALADTVGRQQQAILFLNRRGYAPIVSCRSCGEPVKCRDCSVALTFHQRTGLLECHYCAHGEPLPALCPACGAAALHLLGAGTEKVEELLRSLLGAEARVARLDSDVAPGRASEAVLDRVRAEETNILVGTQLVTKGHDLPGVTLVGVLLADATLHFPDFRATERTFQLLTQVAGRAGRGELEGRVLIQTFSPNHPVIRFAMHHDYQAFFRFELETRRELGYPPWGHLAAIGLSGPDESRVKQAGEALVSAARQLPEVCQDRVQVKGPAPAPLARVRGRFRYRILVQSDSRAPLRRVLAQLQPLADEARHGVRTSFDIDPVHLL